MNKMLMIPLLACACAAAVVAHAQAPYPARAVRIVVPYAPGGNGDILNRLIAQKLTEAWGHPVTVDNRTGAGTNIGAEIAAHAAPDGYTLFFASTANSVNMTLYNKVSYDIIKDFAPVTLLIGVSNIIAVHPTVPAKSVKQLIALAKAKPGQLAYASIGSGSSSHLSGELFKMMAGIDMLHVPYKGGSPAAIALITGEVSVGFVNVLSYAPIAKLGKVRGLAVTSGKRSAVVPQLPTIAESGLPGYEQTAWGGLMAPAATAPALIAKLNEDVIRAIKSPDVTAKLAAQGVDVVTSTPSEFAAFLRADVATYAKLIKSLNLKAE